MTYNLLAVFSFSILVYTVCTPLLLQNPSSTGALPSELFSTAAPDPVGQNVAPRPQLSLQATDNVFAEDGDDDDDPFSSPEAHDDCDVPLDINAKASDVEEEEKKKEKFFGRGQRKNVPATRYLGPAWEEH
ncbi:hypothetical protein R3P38DRAFT_3234196 [Favolaschia claudopus]|uniref:Uncharacterized protein n=1 Tax=Favolaschia claudopus TaxID=2862362 RepID=A0AAV9ZH80_9AGAR